MSVLCCRVPDFLVRLHRLHHSKKNHSDEDEGPLALLGVDDRVWAASPRAQTAGIQLQMTPRQVQMRCPDAILRYLEAEQAQVEQERFLHTIATWDLPVEPIEWGAAYLDLHQLATQPDDVRSLCREMGRSLRKQMGEVLQPSLGWDSGKFTARAAAVRTAPGRMRLVPKEDEVRFLHPLPTTLLPLPASDLQHLSWLGIDTLGQFARLPETAVWQRFGQAGKLARRWAQGRDDRPVIPGTDPSPLSIQVDFDPPAENLPRVLNTMLDGLRPTLVELGRNLQGIRHLTLHLIFCEDDTHTLDFRFVESIQSESRLRLLLEQKLESLIWPSALSAIEMMLVHTGELPIGQPMLFAEMEERSRDPLLDLAQGLRSRHGPIFFSGAVVEAGHLLPERRSRLIPLE